MGSKGGRATPRESTGVLGALFHRTTLRGGPWTRRSLASRGGLASASPLPIAMSQLMPLLTSSSNVWLCTLPSQSSRDGSTCKQRRDLKSIRGMIRGGEGGREGGKNQCRSIGGRDRLPPIAHRSRPRYLATGQGQ